MLQGIAASYHCVIGKAYVILGKNGVKNISPRDIVVIRNIDMGWSLYFPVIAGLVAEFGGLMSHGEFESVFCEMVLLSMFTESSQVSRVTTAFFRVFYR